MILTRAATPLHLTAMPTKPKKKPDTLGGFFRAIQEDLLLIHRNMAAPSFGENQLHRSLEMKRGWDALSIPLSPFSLNQPGRPEIVVPVFIKA